ncbi:MAG: formate dehydrogenase subunit gamma [Bryobacteraceae bacterium]
MTGEIVRYNYTERLCHWLAGLSYTYCLIGGLAFYSPNLYWLSALLGGGPTARYWHPVVGVVFLAAVAWMHQMWSRDMKTTDADRQWLKAAPAYIQNRDELVPPQGRFNAGQKQFYWAMLFGSIFLFFSGIALWFPESIPADLRWIRPAAIVIHEIAALITIGAFIIHVYMGLFFVPGGLSGIVTGTVSKDWARAHHRLWFDKVTAGKK